MISLETMETRGRWWAVAGGRMVGVGVLMAVALGACTAETGGNGGPGETPQIGLQRGGRWSVLTVKPPHLTGPQFNLLLKGGVLSGSISNGTAPGGNIHVSIAEDGAEGHGPLGPVAMDFISTPDSTTAQGMWNGHRVHIVFTKESVKGTIADNSDVMTRGDPDAAIRARTRQRMGNIANSFDPSPRNSSCEYFLNELASDGALTGGSICSGMPQPTRLEVPSMAQTWLTRPELVTVLVAVLSSPPVGNAEENGPRFDNNPPDPPVAPVIIRRR
jgi:hypothetical protein